MKTVIGFSQSVVLRWVCLWVLLCMLSLAHAQNASKMALLLPDGLALTQSQVTVWTDAAQEQGFQLAIVRNAAFLQRGPGIRAEYSGIIVPDQMQVSMSDALVVALENYVAQGGHLMLVYDAGALTTAGFYAIPKSRFSALVGVDYVLYEALRERTIGLGPAVGQVSTLRALQVPPGKSMPFALPAQLPLTTALTAEARAGRSADFLPASPANPGGMSGHDHRRYFTPPLQHKHDGLAAPGERIRDLLAHQRQRTQPQDRSEQREQRELRREGRLLKHERAVKGEQVARATRLNFAGLRGAVDPAHSISGYVYGALTYPSFVTEGEAQGQVLLSSPAHGLVASSRQVGSGSVLFVNLPLTYLKLSEDALPLHGFLHWFASASLKQPRLASVPGGVGGLVFNWHLDSNLALAPMLALKDLGVWKHKPFSMHMTAGPDTIVPGDKIGFDLPRNPVAQRFLRDLDRQGHEIGSHGGWIHDYYGNNANETNAAEYLNYLVLNRNAIEAAIGHPMKEYSAPQGNNPLWSLAWLTQNNFSAYYTLSHTGAAATRSYRQGQLVQPKLWAFPVTPLGTAATFEEFSELALTDLELNQWYAELVDFSIHNQSNRMIYAHPPGAMLYPAALLQLLQYTRQQQQAGQFRWYTMAQLATFMSARAQASWSSGLHSNGKMRVTASHPATLTDLTWVYSKNAYARPTAVSGTIQVLEQGEHWLVRVVRGRAAAFEAAPI
ncbi:MAG: hypothetical protein ACKVIH_08440 [Burkholderiales bacterium]